jgi:hypothetical protein
MKIRHFFAMLTIATVMLCALFVSGCGVKPQPLTPQQIATIACPQLDLVHTQLTAFNAALEADPATAAVGQKASAQLAVVHAIVTKVCNGASAAPLVDASSVQALVQTGLPALAYLAGSLPLPPAQQAQVQAALVLAETAAGVVGVVEAQVAAAHAAPASASSASGSK